MRRALEYAGGLGVTLAQHCEDETLAAGGHMHEGEWSSRLGIPGQPAEAEELMVMRDIALARLTGAPVHFQHLSTAGSVAMVRAARANGMAVTAEATTHHFTLTHAACAVVRPGVQGEPAVAHRGRRGRDAGRAGRRRARRDRHRPRAPRARGQGAAVRPGASRACSASRRRSRLALTELGLPIEAVLALLSWQPAAIAGLASTHGGPIAAGYAANLVRDRSDRRVDRRSVAAREPQSQHALRGSHADGPGAPHDPRRRAGRDRRRGRSDERARRARRAARPRGRHDVRGRGDRRAGRPSSSGEVVFNTVLSGYQEVITDPSYAGQIITLHLSAHRQLRRDRARRGEPPAVLPRRHRA